MQITVPIIEDRGRGMSGGSGCYTFSRLGLVTKSFDNSSEILAQLPFYQTDNCFGAPL